MFTTDEIIDLIRTGYIPPDPGRLGEFGRVLEALGERRSTEPLGDERLEALRKLGSHAASTEPLCGEIRRLQAELKRRENRQSDGNDWAVATFGPATIESTMRRIDQEMREFYEDPVGEAKDIAIFLYRLMSVAGKDLDAEVDAKMEVNRKREWVLNGEGCGQHVGSTAKKGVMEELLDLRAQLAAAGQRDNPSDCYCVCHSKYASRSNCEHCKGINEVSDFHLRKRISELGQASEARGQEVERLRKAIIDAPHDSSPGRYGDPECGSLKDPGRKGYGPCDCWKSEALATPAATPADSVGKESLHTGDNSVVKDYLTTQSVDSNDIRTDKDSLTVAPEYRCTMCNGLAEWSASEKVWRHESGDPLSDRLLEQSFCDKYGYPIEVLASAATPAVEQADTEGGK